MIPFNKPPYTGHEDKYVLQALQSTKMSGDGEFTRKCHQWFESNLKIKKALLTSSCTHALEMAAILLDIKDGDEIIMPSFTFPSTANAFVLRGAKLVFVDIRPDTMNLDENQIEKAITKKTKAIVPVHYAGISCEMNTIMKIAEKYNLFVIEDAAQGMMSTYNNQYLGTIGHMGAFSFHETKNYTSAGEGGLLLINDERFIKRAEIIREKGTNRNQFFRKEVDKYTWVDIGSSYLLNDISAAYLWGQLEKVEEIKVNRLNTWNLYYERLQELSNKAYIQLPQCPKECLHNGHLFYIKAQNREERDQLLKHLLGDRIYAVFHYIPLHSSPAGVKFGRLSSNDKFTTLESQKLIRLPLFYGLTEDDLMKVVNSIQLFSSSQPSMGDRIID